MNITREFLENKADKMALYSYNGHRDIMNYNEESYNKNIGKYIDIVTQLENMNVEVIDSLQHKDITLRYNDIEIVVNKFKYFK